MDLTLLLTGVIKLGFGILVGIIGITTAARIVKRVNGLTDLNESLRENNWAVGISLAAAITSIGILIEPAINGTFSALQLLSYTAEHWMDVAWVVLYAIVHVVAALLLGALVISLGTQIAVRLTPDIDEIEEIRKGNISCALLMAAIMLTLALLSQEGLQMVLDGMLPMPTLGRDSIVGPA